MDPLKGRMGESKADVLRLAEEIKMFEIDQIYTGHCTGEEARGLLCHKMGNTVKHFQTGSEIRL